MRRSAATMMVETRIMALDDAKLRWRDGAVCEKYDDQVRVLHKGFFHRACGGTHVKAVGDIGFSRSPSRPVSLPACVASRRSPGARCRMGRG